MSIREPWVGRRLPWWRFRARRREQMKCQHPKLRERLVDVGNRKMFWCDDCSACWFS